ncbi:aminodeoxychorismate lyase [Intrasporangium oryzae NRRL B-24470]|uniref:Endolytic murein transglycosylase n=1 Tax=Intrasporangium oryzae NRRL B-24470 TaxID=1386089 RepID=W9GA54_9MICO|nr:endolytic transglycosylase MltG [Intrasporangium oryzae]EWT02955.1 aminodeoxychorismate lyase [Intrasporangium oryzae NRRL B-24470]
MKDHLESSIFGDHDDQLDVQEYPPAEAEAEAPAAVPRTRREVREAEEAAKRNAKRRGRTKDKAPAGAAVKGRPSVLRRIAVILLALIVVGGGVAVAYTYLWPVVADMLEPNDYPGPGTGEVQVRIEEGAGGSAIARLLAADDVVKSSKAFIEAARDEPRSAGIQPGVYELRKQMRARDALAILIDPKNRITTAVTIPEGLWAKEIYAKLSDATGIPVAEYVAAAKDPAALGLPAAAKGNVEGYLFPASYTFDPGTSAKDQLAKMVAESTKRLEALGVPENDMERVMTIASLVEAEAKFEADRPKVARVVDNRLAAKMPLQFDSTVNYAEGKHGITTTNEARASASPYNTYKVVGLPPGPIGNPGESAIRAAAQPADGPWLYFVTVNPTTGETKFAATYAEHQKNVAQFQAWCAANKGKC